MIKFELKKAAREIAGYENRHEVKPGCVFDQNDIYDELIASFDDKDKALEALKECKSEVYAFRNCNITFYHVTEYFVQENEYDEDGDWISGGDIWDFSEMDLSELEL